MTVRIAAEWTYELKRDSEKSKKLLYKTLAAQA